MEPDRNGKWESATERPRTTGSIATMSQKTYQTEKTFELQTGLKTKIVVEVSSHESDGRKRYRIGVFRVYRNAENEERRSPYLGMREAVLKTGLERQALDFISAQQAERPVAA
jgi:hypothetical protein